MAYSYYFGILLGKNWIVDETDAENNEEEECQWEVKEKKIKKEEIEECSKEELGPMSPAGSQDISQSKSKEEKEKRKKEK